MGKTWCASRGSTIELSAYARTIYQREYGAWVGSLGKTMKQQLVLSWGYRMMMKEK